MKDIIGNTFIIDGEILSVKDFESVTSDIVSPVYEVLRMEEGIPLFLEDHFLRLENTFGLLSRELTFNRKDIAGILQKLFVSNKIISNPVKLLFFEQNGVKHSIAYFMKTYQISPEEYNSGVKTIFLHDERMNPNAKVWNENFRKTSIRLLEQSGAFEAILVNREGYITEGSRSNIFFIKDDSIFTSPSDLVLPGITRKKVLSICDKMNIPVMEEKTDYTKIGEYDAGFLTGTSRKILPINCIDKSGFRVENPLMLKISNAFEELTVEYISRRKTDHRR